MRQWNDEKWLSSKSWGQALYIPNLLWQFCSFIARILCHYFQIMALLLSMIFGLCERNRHEIAHPIYLYMHTNNNIDSKEEWPNDLNEWGRKGGELRQSRERLTILATHAGAEWLRARGRVEWLTEAGELRERSREKVRLVVFDGVTTRERYRAFGNENEDGF